MHTHAQLVGGQPSRCIISQQNGFWPLMHQSQHRRFASFEGQCPDQSPESRLIGRGDLYANQVVCRSSQCIRTVSGYLPLSSVGYQHSTEVGQQIQATQLIEVDERTSIADDCSG